MDVTRTSRYERYDGGSPAAEIPIFEAMAREIMRVQERNRRRAGLRSVRRAFHARPLLGVEDARLEVGPALGPDLRQGCFVPGATLPVTVRLSAASGMPRPDTEPDLYGLAVRVHADGVSHDLLMTNFEVSPAANAREFVAMAVATAGRTSRAGRLVGLLTRLPLRVGPRATLRIVRNLARSARTVDSLAEETYWSRGAILWGTAGPVRYRLRPLVTPAAAKVDGASRLRGDLARRLSAGEVVFAFEVQRFVSERRTPVEDTAKRWDAPWEPVARLVLPQRECASAESVLAEHRVERLAFNPWNTTDDFRPLGNLNRARRAAYEASSACRSAERYPEDEPRRQALAAAAAGTVFRVVDRVRPWHALPTPLALLNLSLMRRRLRQHNLIDPARPDSVEVRSPATPSAEARTGRTYTGRDNDLSEPAMGSVGTVFGRNMANGPTVLGSPDPISVADRLMTRGRFIPAPSLNVLAAAWIQFQVHDWVNHRRRPLADDPIRLPLPPGRPWRNRPGDGPPDREMLIARDADAGINATSHWWDGSEVYGADEERARELREDKGRGARLVLDGGHLPLDRGLPLTGFSDSWWLGLSIVQTLFAREHNAVCDALEQEYPGLGPERTYQTARLVVSALIAKIHTVEWTPAILATEVIDQALNVNWRGAQSHLLTRFGLRLLDPRAVHGIPGSSPGHDGVPFALTEEFVTVYRMHPLIPDDYVFLDHASGRERERAEFLDIHGLGAEKMHRRIGLPDAVFSFGKASPGAVSLHNFPNALRAFERDGEMVDLAVVDILRTRTRGVPRYNEFRAALHMPPVRSFAELTDDPSTRATLAELYGEVDRVDTVVGLLAEQPPAGFGFSDTAFRIFLLMASRRLQSDRFLTVDYRPEIYTELGLDWVERGGMADVIRRHCPELSGTVPEGRSVFAPWS
ncbi:hypothetical protein GCM10010472_45660 [Pseudonocardia halophobica]|uniref:Peroxidase n=1 Tax=Pseudonocardia halophobica TaxID=29401 RepID=A0A9W6NYM4_9PSEU|nr:peroxidase family protein [Pseudonocardia halophobica]GLL13901.1 hypothetical protein GCM10017577_50460 [Pseudonocardia halophobica]